MNPPDKIKAETKFYFQDIEEALKTIYHDEVFEMDIWDDPVAVLDQLELEQYGRTIMNEMRDEMLVRLNDLNLFTYE